MVLTVMGGSQFALSEQGDYDWIIFTEKATEWTDAVKLAEDSGLDPASSGKQSVKTRQKSGALNYVMLAFSDHSGAAGGVFTPKRVQEMCKAEALIFESVGNGGGKYGADPEFKPASGCVKKKCAAPFTENVCQNGWEGCEVTTYQGGFPDYCMLNAGVNETNKKGDISDCVMGFAGNHPLVHMDACC